MGTDIRTVFTYVGESPLPTTAQREKMLKAYEEAMKAVEALEVARRAPRLDDAYWEWATKMAALARACQAAGVTIETPKALNEAGYVDNMGANGEGLEADNWMPSSVCW